MNVKDVSFAYAEKKILDHISLDIKRGSITTLLGANGSGKTTLFNLMTGHLKPAEGQILLEGSDIRKIKLRELARKVAIVHQNNKSDEDMTVQKLIAYGRLPYTRMMCCYTEKDDALIEWAMEVTGVTDYKNNKMGKLSGGQRQRVWIAMALAQDTEIIFLDEPTTYLDMRYQIEILHLIRKLNQNHGKTIVMVLHDINQAITFSDQIIGLKNGKAIICGNPQEVVTEEILKELYGIHLDVKELAGQKFVLAV